MTDALVLPADAVVFDSDGVLVDSDASVIRAWTAWAVERGLDPVHTLSLVHGRPAGETVAMLVSAPDVAAAVADIHLRELQDASTIRAIPGAAALLAELPAGRWAVVTSATTALARARLAAAGLPKPSVLVSADEVRRGKPDPEGYATALRLLSVPPDRAIVLEDAATGIAAARAAGVELVVGVGPRALDSGATVVVDDLKALSWIGALLVSSEGRMR
ncbi:MAG TPA: HAD-IA family hydrolase [Candidatus Limnocylindria bacterium]|nr:HAD-IA family hydrolase [Candidatus Limnocylindria bacterium]